MSTASPHDSPAAAPPAAPSARQLEQLERSLHETQARLQEQLDRLATAEAQRDELADRLACQEQRRRVERVLDRFGVVDPEAALLLLEKDGRLKDAGDEPAIAAAVEALLIDRPYLGRPGGPLPGGSATGRAPRPLGAHLVDAARRAARTGDRRDVAAYLRLRRRMAR